MTPGATKSSSQQLAAVLSFMFLVGLILLAVYTPLIVSIISWLWGVAMRAGSFGIALAIGALLGGITLVITTFTAIFSPDVREYCYGG